MFLLFLFIFSFCVVCFFFFNDTATTEIYTLSLHDALPISANRSVGPACDEQAPKPDPKPIRRRSEEHTSELQSLRHLVCRLLLEKKKCQWQFQHGQRDERFPVGWPGGLQLWHYQQQLCLRRRERHGYYFLNDTAPTEIYTLSLHDALPISRCDPGRCRRRARRARARRETRAPRRPRDRKSTRLNSSHLGISYAVFCLKKKNAFVNRRSNFHRSKPHSFA